MSKKITDMSRMIRRGHLDGVARGGLSKGLMFYTER